MFHIVLVEPEIPPNTGNVIRLCANTGAHLHLIRPLGFPIDHARMRRAGLDYHEFTQMQIHDDWPAFRSTWGTGRLFALSTAGNAAPSDVALLPGDGFVFGKESAGLPPEVIEAFPPERRLRLPMRPDNRSLNLSNAVAVTVFEAWRQNAYAGAVGR